MTVNLSKRLAIAEYDGSFLLGDESLDECEVCDRFNQLAEEAERLRCYESDANGFVEMLDSICWELESLGYRPNGYGGAENALTVTRKVVAEITTLRNELADIQNSERTILAEDCPTDEIHCGCVPTLRGEMERLVGDKEHAISQLTQQSIQLREQSDDLMSLGIRNEKLVEALGEIDKCCSPFDRDPLQRTINAVEYCQEIARTALDGQGGDGDG